MASADRVLTVAFGTFSCTLEGFDDPSAAMAEIAGYFRKLADDDRHPGAAPPAPDMTMLRQIAESGTRQKVVAYRAAEGIVLHAAPPDRDTLRDGDGSGPDRTRDADLSAEASEARNRQSRARNGATEEEAGTDRDPDDAAAAETWAATTGNRTGAELSRPHRLPSDPDVERLFAATDSRLSGEEVSRRQAGISHLKAAVAARKAGSAAPAPRPDRSRAYRADLTKSVSPPRPQRPPPLVLVSAQRVERAAAPDFAHFAQEMGAVDLPDLLEAAAVYCVKILREPRFSRSRLMDLAAEVFEGLNRDEGLRAFGRLLRRGTLSEVERGRYGLGMASRYAARADRRAEGG